MNYITVFPPILFTAALIYRNYLQSKINSTKYHNLIHECKNNYKSTWSMLSNTKGTELRWQIVIRYLLRRQLPTITSPTPNIVQKIHVLETLMIFLRGNVLDGLVVQNSTIPQAGNGLFTTRSFPKGALLCVYSGTSVSFAQAMKRQRDGIHGDYVMGGFGLNWRVDAEPHPEVLARYINDHYLQPMKTNVKFIKLKEQRVALIVTLRDLIPGEEIFASYGQGYWRKRLIQQE